jgi:hypothetical protein
MKNQMIASSIVGASIIIAAAVWVYFSPYHSCMRALEADVPNIPGTINAMPNVSKVSDRVRLCLGK